VSSMGFGFWIMISEFRVSVSGFRVSCLGFRGRCLVALIHGPDADPGLDSEGGNGSGIDCLQLPPGADTQYKLDATNTDI